MAMRPHPQTVEAAERLRDALSYRRRSEGVLLETPDSAQHQLVEHAADIAACCRAVEEATARFDAVVSWRIGSEDQLGDKDPPEAGRGGSDG